MAANTYLGADERRILESAKIGIAGAGGLGSNCAAHLVRAGIRKLVVADFDVVSESNLNRQFYFRDQIGMKKTAALEANLRRIEDGLEIEAIDMRLDEGNIARVFADCSIVVEAFDVADRKQMLYKALLPEGKTVVSAAGLAGWGRSGAMKLRKVGRGLYLAGDCESEAGSELAPESPRVGIAAAIEANTVVALLLGLEP